MIYSVRIANLYAATIPNGIAVSKNQADMNIYNRLAYSDTVPCVYLCGYAQSALTFYIWAKNELSGKTGAIVWDGWYMQAQ